jgi:hypothetical protein
VAKTSGLGAAIAVADSGGTSRIITNDVTDFTMSTPVNLYDWTGVDKSAHERGPGLADAKFTLKGILNNGSNMSHMVLSSMSSTYAIRAIQVTPTNQTKPYLGANCWIASYDVARGNDGNLTWASELDLGDGASPTWTNS